MELKNKKILVTGADAIAMSFCHSYDFPLVIARPFNTYGPRQSARAVILTIITQIAAGKKEIKIGSLSPTRDFNYVKDILRGMILLAGCNSAVGEVVNIGSNSEISIKEIDSIDQEANEFGYRGPYGRGTAATG